jgi:hypothetical protein
LRNRFGNDEETGIGKSQDVVFVKAIDRNASLNPHLVLRASD